MKIKISKTLNPERLHSDQLISMQGVMHGKSLSNGHKDVASATEIFIDPVSGHQVIASIQCTEPQSEILVTCMLGGDDANRAFNQSATLHLKGDLSIPALESAIALLIQRHESLRTVFDIATNSFLVLKTLPVKLEVGSLPVKGDHKTIVENQVHSEALHVFNLRTGPLFKATLLTDGANDHYLVFTLHHIIFDGWTLNLVVEELALLYNAFAHPLEEPFSTPVRYSDYARQEHQFTAGPAYKKMKDYWLDKYQQYKPHPVLPYDHARSEQYTYKSSTINFPIDKTLLSRVKQLAEKHQCSLLVTMASMFEVLLYKLSGNQQFVLGIPTAGQPVSGYDDLMGHCVNLLPVKVTIDGNSGFSEYLEARKKVYAEAFDNRRVTLGSLLKTLKMDRGAAAAPFLPVTFNVYRAVMKEVLFEGLTTELYINPREYSSFDMLLDLIRKEHELEIICSYNEALFERSTILSFLEEYKDLVEQICLPEKESIDKLSLSHIHARPATRLEEAEVVKDNDVHRRDKVYWLEKLSGDLPVLEMPTDKPRPLGKTLQHATFHHLIDANLVAKYNKLVRTENKSEFIGLLSVLYILLHRYTEQEDIIIGHKVRVQGYSNEGERDNTVALRCQLKGEDNFSQLLDNLERVVADAYKHQQYPFEELVAELNVADTKSRNPLFDVMILFENGPDPGLTGADLVFAFIKGPNTLQLRIYYDVSLFEEPTIRRMSSHIDGLLRAITMLPSKAINMLDYLGSQEKRQLLYEFNDTKTAYDTDITLLDLFMRQVSKVPDHLAVTDGVNSITYSELDRKSDALAAKLHAISKDEDIYIAVHLERSVDMIVSLISILKAGKAYLPLEPYVPADRKSVMLNATPCSVLITDTVNFQLSQELMVPGLTVINVGDRLETPAAGWNSGIQVVPADIAYVIFTSGSTGIPKGVIVRHTSVVNLIEWVNGKFGINEDDHALCTASVSFDLSVYDIFGMLAAGASIRVATSAELRDPHLLTEIVCRENITFWNSAPSVLHQLIPFFKKLPAPENPSLRLVFLSGDWIPLLLPDQVKSIFPGVTVIALGGATEATVWSNYFKVDKIDPVWKSIPYGRPVQNAYYYILNSALQPVPIGVTGDLYIGGDVLAMGYTDAEISSRKFIQSPFLPNEKIYYTGDKARFYRDGNIEFLGRVDDQVKIRGYRIELGDIESALQKHSKVERVIVLVKEESRFQKSLVAYVMNHAGMEANELRNYLSSKLPPYYIPDHFMIMQEFPLTPNGKIDRKKLPKPGEIHSDNLSTEDLIETETEKLIARIWSNVLGIEDIRKNDNFFEIGGHSLKAIEVVLRIENETGCKLPMSSLMTHPSVKSLATLLVSDEKSAWKYLVPIKSSGSKPPIYIVHGAGLGVMVFQDIANDVDKEQPVYGIQAMGLNGDESPARTIEEIAGKYLNEILQQNPEGPYLLAGFSAGSVIAYEMARQLKDKGKTIAFLGNFDYSLELLKRRHIPIKERMKKMIFEFFPRQSHFLKNLIRHPSESWKFQTNFLELRVMSLAKRLGYKKECKASPGIKRINEIIDQYIEALDRYEMKPYDGTLDIFSSRIKIYYLRDNKYLGWKKYITQGIAIHSVNGDHDHIILPPNSKDFANTLQRVIDYRLTGKTSMTVFQHPQLSREEYRDNLESSQIEVVQRIQAH